ncbi:MAG TPA: hypothetical protein VGE13_02095 [Candidatus Saccharimonadales bacterium]
MTVSMEIPTNNEVSERDSLTLEIIEGLPSLTTVQLQGILSIIRARRGARITEGGDVDA